MLRIPFDVEWPRRASRRLHVVGATAVRELGRRVALPRERCAIGVYVLDQLAPEPGAVDDALLAVSEDAPGELDVGNGRQRCLSNDLSFVGSRQRDRHDRSVGDRLGWRWIAKGQAVQHVRRAKGDLGHHDAGSEDDLTAGRVGSDQGDAPSIRMPHGDTGLADGDRRRGAHGQTWHPHRGEHLWLDALRRVEVADRQS
ncbi:MAG: hypothetical protein FD127_4113 [Acidimicrobiaceae bacterium]|nr:MAG: hypothetical protein FD127_4113 [Acidimicrobiaceae bacterium]